MDRAVHASMAYLSADTHEGAIGSYSGGPPPPAPPTEYCAALLEGREGLVSYWMTLMSSSACKSPSRADICVCSDPISIIVVAGRGGLSNVSCCASTSPARNISGTPSCPARQTGLTSSTDSSSFSVVTVWRTVCHSLSWSTISSTSFISRAFLFNCRIFFSVSWFLGVKQQQSFDLRKSSQSFSLSSTWSRSNSSILLVRLCTKAYESVSMAMNMLSSTSVTMPIHAVTYNGVAPGEAFLSVSYSMPSVSVLSRYPKATFQVRNSNTREPYSQWPAKVKANVMSTKMAMKGMMFPIACVSTSQMSNMRWLSCRNLKNLTNENTTFTAAMLAVKEKTCVSVYRSWNLSTDCSLNDTRSGPKVPMYRSQ
mmetsp:Transcript_13298/g.31713  ORF Transcript_13298/g.31713 Transcript_13298/m.31713 type:complete len:368 (-) Transcript_13298:1080-2183(-)